MVEFPIYGWRYVAFEFCNRMHLLFCLASIRAQTFRLLGGNFLFAWLDSGVIAARESGASAYRQLGAAGWSDRSHLSFFRIRSEKSHEATLIPRQCVVQHLPGSRSNSPLEIRVCARNRRGRRPGRIFIDGWSSVSRVQLLCCRRNQNQSSPAQTERCSRAICTSGWVALNSFSIPAIARGDGADLREAPSPTGPVAYTLAIAICGGRSKPLDGNNNLHCMTKTTRKSPLCVLDE